MLSAWRVWKDPSFAFFLLLPPSAHRITDFINADRNGPVVYLSLSSGMDCPWCFKCSWVILPPGGAHKWPPLWTKVGENFIKTTKKISSADKSYWILPAMPTLFQKYVGPRHIIHSDFDFFLSYFVLFVLFLFPLFCVFVSVFVLICSFCVSTPPLLCLQLAPSVSNHPSDLSPFCMHRPYTPLLCAAWQSIAVALTLPCLTNTCFASHSVSSELLWWL